MTRREALALVAGVAIGSRAVGALRGNQGASNPFWEAHLAQCKGCQRILRRRTMPYIQLLECPYCDEPECEGSCLENLVPYEEYEDPEEVKGEVG